MVCMLPPRASICPVVVLRSWEPPAFPITNNNLPIIMVCVLPGRTSIWPVVVLRSWDPPAYPSPSIC
jgi:hypothetical protein